MPVTVTMPEVAETIVEGTINKWLKQPGDPVERYESIAEIVTDKVTLELPSPATGIMGELLVAEGDTVTIDTPIAIIHSDVPLELPDPVSAPESASTETPAPKPQRPRRPTFSPREETRRGTRHRPVFGPGHGRRGTDHQGRCPSGRRGPGHSNRPPWPSDGRVDPVRRAIAQRMTQSSHDIPHVWTMMEVDVSGLVVALVKASKA